MLFLRYVLWIAPNVTVATVLARLLHLRLQHRFPAFLTYTAYQLFEFLTLLIVNVVPSFSRLHYRWVLTAGLGVSSVLKFAIVYEVAKDLIQSHSALTTTLRLLLRWIAALLLLASVVASAVVFTSGMGEVEEIFHVLDLSSNLVLTGLLLVLFLFKRAFHIRWQSYAVGIALGFGIFASVDLAVSALRVNYGDVGNIRIDLIYMAGYQLCVLVWLTYLFLPENRLQVSGTSPRKSELEHWNEELQKMVHR